MMLFDTQSAWLKRDKAALLSEKEITTKFAARVIDYTSGDPRIVCAMLDVLSEDINQAAEFMSIVDPDLCENECPVKLSQFHPQTLRFGPSNSRTQSLRVQIWEFGGEIVRV